MSTRASIKIQNLCEQPVYMYHHYDGYPSGVGSELKYLLKQFTETEWTCDSVANFLNNTDSQYEFANNVHGDIAYLYVIDCANHNIVCYQRSYDSNYLKIDKWLKEFEKYAVEIPDVEPNIFDDIFNMFGNYVINILDKSKELFDPKTLNMKDECKKQLIEYIDRRSSYMKDDCDAKTLLKIVCRK